MVLGPAGTPVPGVQGGVVEAFPGVPLLVLPGGVVEPAGFVVEPGVVPEAVVPVVVPGVTHGLLVVPPGLVTEPVLPGLGDGCAVPPLGDVMPGEVVLGVVVWLGVVVVPGEVVAGVVVWLGVVVVL